MTVTGLKFKPVSLEAQGVIRYYMEMYGENSCQHSFVSMYSLYEKYGDAVWEQDGFLYTLREHLCREHVRVYLAPMGAGDKRKAFQNILDDAHRHNAVAEFQTLTDTAKRFLETEFPGQFEFQNLRDYAEYLYTAKKLAMLSGNKLSGKRYDANVFRRVYGSRMNVGVIQENDFDEILSFEKKWLLQCQESHDTDALMREFRVIQKQLDHYRELNLSGIVLRIDGTVCGFGYGVPISASCYDALIEKGDRKIPNIYRILNQEAVRQCAMDYIYVNREEDVGVPGLRVSKLAYQPDILMNKYLAMEKLGVISKKI